MEPIIIIPARLGATRLPNKPLIDINGKPMIVRVMEQAEKAGIASVIVACDDKKIETVVEKAGGKAIITSTNHHSGSDRIFEALEEIDISYDVIINLQGDLPTVHPSVLQDVLKPLENEEVDISTAVSPIVDFWEKDDPHVVKAILGNVHNKIGRALYFTRANAPYGDGISYHHIGIYAYRKKTLEKFVFLPPSELEKREKLEQLRALENNMRIDAVVVDTVPLGVDTQEDLEKVTSYALDNSD